MTEADSILGAVLAGGRSTRMGYDKADATIGDVTMLEWVVETVRAITTRVVVLGPDREGRETWPDSVHAQGPLAGLATALSRMEESHVLLVAVDHPFLRAETLRRMIALAGELPLVPVDDHGTRQVTCSIYPKTIAGAALEEAATGGSVQSLLDRVSFRPVAPEEWQSWGEDGRSWFSVDSPESLREGIGLYGED